MSEPSDDQEAPLPNGERFFLEIPRDLVPSPCQGLCVVDEQGSLCVGCFRSLHEIGGWGGFSADQKREVLLVVDQRRQAFEASSKAQSRLQRASPKLEEGSASPPKKSATKAPESIDPITSHHTLRGGGSSSKLPLPRAMERRGDADAPSGPVA